VLWGERARRAATFEAVECSINFFWQKGHVENTFLFYQGCYLYFWDGVRDFLKGAIGKR
jgi:hypothetical protein